MASQRDPRLYLLAAPGSTPSTAVLPHVHLGMARSRLAARVPHQVGRAFATPALFEYRYQMTRVSWDRRALNSPSRIREHKLKRIEGEL